MDMDDIVWTGPHEVGPWSELSLVIDTENHAGGFERELLAAAFGVLSEYPPGQAEEEASKYNGPDMRDVVGHTMNDTDDVEFSDRVVTYPTPGWGNDGHGGLYRVTPARPAAFPAYLSVRVPLERPLTQEELRGVKDRVAAFALRKGITVTGFRYVRERVEVQTAAL